MHPNIGKICYLVTLITISMATKCLCCGICAANCNCGSCKIVYSVYSCLEIKIFIHINLQNNSWCVHQYFVLWQCVQWVTWLQKDIPGIMVNQRLLKTIQSLETFHLFMTCVWLSNIVVLCKTGWTVPRA